MVNEDVKRLWILAIPALGGGACAWIYFSNILPWVVALAVSIVAALVVFVLLCILCMVLIRSDYRLVNEPVPPMFPRKPIAKPYRVDTNGYKVEHIDGVDVLIPA